MFAGETDSSAHDLLAKSFERMDAKRVFENQQSQALEKLSLLCSAKDNKFTFASRISSQGIFRVKK